MWTQALLLAILCIAQECGNAFTLPSIMNRCIDRKSSSIQLFCTTSVSRARSQAIATVRRRRSEMCENTSGEKGFGSSQGPSPELYHPNVGNDKTKDHSKKHDSSRRSGTRQEIGTLFSSGDEVIRELSSEEYVEVLKEWAPLASFAANEAVEVDVRQAAEVIRNVLRGMAEWQPRRNSDYTKEGSSWSFGAPLGAIKEGQVDALACLQVSEEDGVVIEWVCGNPATLGISGNAVDWLLKGVSVICGRRLDLPVTLARHARGEHTEELNANKGEESCD